MKKISIIFCLFPFAAFAETDAEIALSGTMDIVRSNCSGISARMDKIKKMAGIGTAVNAVGTAAGAGGVASGVVKYYKDVETLRSTSEVRVGEAFEKDLVADEDDLTEEEKKVLDIAYDNPKLKAVKAEYKAMDDEDQEDFKQDVKEILDESKVQMAKNQKSATLAGNIRTGLFATDTASNIAGAVVSSNTVADKDLIQQIKDCMDSLDKLSSARMRVRVEDGINSGTRLMDQSQKILDNCSEYKHADLNKINKLATGAIVSNSIGAATGTAATVSSAIGNNNRISDTQFTEQGFKKVQQNNNVNVASNVLGGVTAAASLIGAALNASQIKIAKKIVAMAEKCESALEY